MNLDFDHDRGGRKQWVQWLTDRMSEAYRVLKPGGYALVWALPRTGHWTGWALEEAGFELKDSIHHCYGSGMPKGLNIGKAIDKTLGAKRKVVGYKRSGLSMNRLLNDDGWYNADAGEEGKQVPETAPATPQAEQWEGWNTQLKPSHEIWWLAQRPISEKTIAANVLRWGVSGLNVDACRLKTADDTSRVSGRNTTCYGKDDRENIRGGHIQGRFPSNQLFSHHQCCDSKQEKCLAYCPSCDHAEPIASLKDCPECGDRMAWACPVALLDEQSGILKPAGNKNQESRFQKTSGGDFSKSYGNQAALASEIGGASRFFPTFHDPVPFHYFPKASKRDRTCNGRVNNIHKTVKNHDLMKRLVRLITPPGGTVLDCFAGSGSTALAALAEGCNYILIEQDPEYAEIAKQRIQCWHDDHKEPIALPPVRPSAHTEESIVQRVEKLEAQVKSNRRKIKKLESTAHQLGLFDAS